MLKRLPFLGCLALAIGLLATGMAPVHASAQDNPGDLETLRNSIRTEPPRSLSAAPSAEQNERCRDRDEGPDADDPASDFLGRLFVASAWATLTAPIVLPRAWADDDYHVAGYFPDYPWRGDAGGNLILYRPGLDDFKTWSLQTQTEYADNFDGLSRIGTRFQLDTTSRFGLDAEFNYWRESLGERRLDDLWTGDLNGLYRFAQAEWMQMRIGPGINWLSDEIGTDFGFNLSYQGDFFPRKSWIISAELDWGTLGDEMLLHTRITTGWQWKHLEVFTGYDLYRVADTALQGMLGGIRVWF